MKNSILPLFVPLLVATLSGCGEKATGGGTLPSADQNAQHKASFGFNYHCSDEDNTLTGHFTYIDHGTGHRFAGKINNLLVGLDNVPIGCGVTIAPGVGGACVIAKSGSGGVQEGDIALMVVGDGKVFSGFNDQDGVEIALIRPLVPVSPSAALSLSDCIAAAEGGTQYYGNGSNLTGGNITWFEE